MSDTTFYQIGKIEFKFVLQSDWSTIITNQLTGQSVHIPANIKVKEADLLAKQIGCNLKTIRKRNKRDGWDEGF